MVNTTRSLLEKRFAPELVLIRRIRTPREAEAMIARARSDRRRIDRSDTFGMCASIFLEGVMFFKKSLVLYARNTTGRIQAHHALEEALSLYVQCLNLIGSEAVALTDPDLIELRQQCTFEAYVAKTRFAASNTNPNHVVSSTVLSSSDQALIKRASDERKVLRSRMCG